MKDIIELPKGYSKLRIYSIFYTMLKRCYNSRNTLYLGYGARGIRVCDDWKNDFKSFYIWAMSNGYTDELSIDRIDNNGNYEPSNCRWVTLTVQARNKRVIQVNNTSGYKGVYFNKKRGKYRTAIYVNSKNIHLGYFDTAEEGAIAYNHYVVSNNTGHNLNIIKKEDISQ